MIYKAKKGDKVRCVENYVGGSFTAGKVYELREDFDHYEEYASVRVTEDDRGSTTNGWGQKFFEPVSAEMLKKSNPLVRTFSTGATRDLDENKLDFEGFFSPLVMEEFAKYMHGKRKMPDGSMRDSDNWQKGIPTDAYMKSMFRHFFAVWKSHRAGTVSREDVMGLMFNVQGYAHETIKRDALPR
jgi:hypothetical protein